MSRADVLVVGAGPAGAATAILLAQEGHQVALLDRATFPREKVCGEYLSPEGSRILDRLGVLKTLHTDGVRPLRGMRLVLPDGTTLVGDYPRSGLHRGFVDHALAVSRSRLDAALVARARALPLTVREGFRVTDLLIEGDRVVGVEGQARTGAPERWLARLVVGADGRNSVVARRLGLVSIHPWLRKIALMSYAQGIVGDPERAEIVLDPPAYSIVNPVEEDLMNVSLVVPATVVRHVKGGLAAYFDQRLSTLLGQRLTGGRRVRAVRAIGPLAYRVAPPRHGGVVLVGDAFGFLDPFTGEGMFTALRSAELAAEVAHEALRADRLEAARLAPVHARRQAELADKLRLATLLQRLIAHRWLATMVGHRLARHPEILELLMGAIGDFVPARQLLSPGVLLRLLR